MQFSKALYPNEAFVARLKLSRKLKGHTGCVNTVNWSQCGRYLVSGSDDRRVCVWDYYNAGRPLASVATTHTANIFCTKFMPYTDNKRIISCAGDNKILSILLDDSRLGGEITHTFTCHEGRVKKLAHLGDSNTFISGSEDGTVRLFDLREKPARSGRICVQLSGFTQINSIGVSGEKVVVGCSDPYARVYDIRMSSRDDSSPIVSFVPTKERTLDQITGVDFQGDEIIASYTGDKVYLFRMDQPDSHRTNTDTGEREPKRQRTEGNEQEGDGDKGTTVYGYVQCYAGHCNVRTIKGVSFIGPGAEYVASGSDDGKIFIWNKRTAQLVNLMQGDKSVVNVISGHPFNCVLATSGIDSSIKIWEPIQKQRTDLSGAEEISRRNIEMAQAEEARGIPISLIRRLLMAGAFRPVFDEDNGEEINEDTDTDSEGNAPECRLH
uniref:Anaphase-promoting complex subunit 4 WD40 domain-containing protein n=1 Tax=Arcella intermedia TaxID=1963864 RepID=A0A6B2L4F7_9EUKA